MNELRLPAHPRLLFDRQGIEALRSRIAEVEWAKKRWRTLQQQGDQWISEDTVLPPRGGNWYHYYACPEHGAALRTGERIGQWQWEHICPVDNKRFRGDPTRPEQDYDGCVLMGLHNQFANRVRDLGILYQVTGDHRYADKAREIACLYAERYASYPLHTIKGEARVGGGKVGPQSLDESVWLIPMAQGVDLIWDTLSQANQSLLAERLFIAAVREVILPHRIRIHNIQCWKNSAVGLVGLLLGDEELVEEAISQRESGFWAQVRHGLTADGVWFEGAWSYHFYTLSALSPLLEAARNCGMNLYSQEVKRMYDAPLRFATPNLILPAFNDSSQVDLRSTAPNYELAYARFKNSEYLRILAQSDRQNDFALWFGEKHLPKPPTQTWRSANYPASGYAILAKGRGTGATWLCMKYGPHGGGHGHPDKLHLEVYAGGQPIAVDPGMARYGVPIHANWYRTTVAHNTLVVDQNDQQPTEGNCLAFGSIGGVDFAVASAGAIYPDTQFIRAVALLDESTFVVLDWVQSKSKHTMDIAFHLQGEWESLPAGVAWEPPKVRGYSYLSRATVRRMDAPFSLFVRHRAGSLSAVTIACSQSAELISATGVGRHSEDRVPALLLRHTGERLQAVWAFHLRGVPLQVTVLPVSAEQPEVLCAQVTLPTGKKRLFALNTSGSSTSIDVPQEAAWKLEGFFGVR